MVSVIILDYHIKCAATKNCDITESILDTIIKSKGVITFQCQSCLSNGATNSCENEVSSKLSQLESSIKQLSKIISEDIISQLNEIKAEVACSMEKSKATEQFVTSKFQHLQMENNSLRKQLNRNHILIYGLGQNLSVNELYNAVFSIGKLLNVEIGHNGNVNLCAYIHQKKSIFKRDLLMKQYFAYGEIKRSQLCETDIHSRIYLNDNLTPLASKLNYFCRKLLKEGKINKFRFFNKDLPEAKIYFPNGDSKLLSFEKLNLMFKSNDASVISGENHDTLSNKSDTQTVVVDKNTGEMTVAGEPSVVEE
ncbi:hypothetical protein CVS40_8311 [Lucilia cuprina]|nr:hypothetical protein CVS40_8311 [Lucilia cuprina]